MTKVNRLGAALLLGIAAHACSKAETGDAAADSAPASTAVVLDGAAGAAPTVYEMRRIRP